MSDERLSRRFEDRTDTLIRISMREEHMNEGFARVLRSVAVVLVGTSVAVHLWWGFPRFLVYAHPRTLAFYIESGGMPDPRPFLFVALVLAVVLGIVATWRGLLSYRMAYALGICLMLGSIGGWVLWHTVLNHGVLLTSADPTAAAAATEGHHQGVLDTLFEHAITLPLEGITKVVELVAVVVLAVLLWADPRATTG